MRVGDVVRVPLGPRDEIAFVVSNPMVRESPRALRAVSSLSGVPRAFDEVGLQLARFIASSYLCTLGEALAAVVLSTAIPRTVDTLICSEGDLEATRHPAIPEQLIDLIRSDLRDGFTLPHLLRHPAARRAGDRAALLRYVGALVKSGDLRRERRFADPRTQAYRVRVLFPGTQKLRGPKVQALLQYVGDQPGVPRAQALLAGFSNAIIARAVKAGALREDSIAPQAQPPEFAAGSALRPTDEQQRAIDALRAKLNGRAFAEILLHGITGSGKTLVYIEAIKQTLRDGGRAIVLVPEISLTPQTASRFEAEFGGRVVVFHSGLSQRERFDAWQACANGSVDIVVGARSAVFAPLCNVRILIVDEAHETSYQQETTPRYHAVAVARERMRIEGGVLVLGSATPSLESYADARANRIDVLQLRRRPSGQPLPAVRIVDMAKEFAEGNRRIFSAALAQAIDERLARREKTVLFVNRRGSAGFILCRSCGEVPHCTHCSVSMTVHRSDGLLRCHYCDRRRSIPQQCARCGSSSVREFGVGTQRVAQEVHRLYPHARIVRMDGDTTTRVGDHARLLDEFATSGDVLVGTQMVAKGLDFPTVTLVGVVAADIGLHAADFRAAERTFALIMQVCGRSGRSRAGEAIVQTYSPDLPAIVHAARHDYAGFAERELTERTQLRYPPATQLLYVGVIGRDHAAAAAQARRYAAALKESGAGEVLGPAAYPIARIAGEWRFRVALKGSNLARLRDAVKQCVIPDARRDRATRLVVAVNP